MPGLDYSILYFKMTEPPDAKKQRVRLSRDAKLNLIIDVENGVYQVDIARNGVSIHRQSPSLWLRRKSSVQSRSLTVPSTITLMRYYYYGSFVSVTKESLSADLFFTPRL